jgi:hypothetical protein
MLDEGIGARRREAHDRFRVQLTGNRAEEQQQNPRMRRLNISQQKQHLKHLIGGDGELAQTPRHNAALLEVRAARLTQRQYR